MADHGIEIILGNDAGLNSFDDFGTVLRNWSEWGFTPDETLDMATVRAARALGLGDVTGRLRPGFAADLLLVAGDPTRDLRALDHIERIVVRGRGYEPTRRSPTLIG